MTLFALSMIALVIYVYFGYFALVIVLAQIIRRKVYQQEIQPSVALMIAAYNEEQGIAKKLENSLLLMYPKEKLRIIDHVQSLNMRILELEEALKSSTKYVSDESSKDASGDASDSDSMYKSRSKSRKAAA